MPTVPAASSDVRRLGRGRAAFVDLVPTAEGTIVRKVFVGDLPSRLVLLATDGAPNPYRWSRDAVEAALLRRRLLRALLRVWFGDFVRLPRPLGVAWNPESRAHEIRAEYVRGRHVPLRSPLPDAGADLLPELLRDVMRPLQEHLEASGFDGLQWQAGRGNPVATSNFLLEASDGGERRWVWVDLESGVPALFSPSPFAQLGFYLPHALRLHRPLFDDVDVPRLRAYLRAERATLEHVEGSGATARLLAQANALERHQARWKGFRRLDRGLIAAVLEGTITADEARAWRRRPVRWGLFVVHETLGLVARAVGRRLRGLGRWVLSVRPRQALRGLVRYLVSQRYRTDLARRYVGARLDAWEERGALDAAGADRLRVELGRDEASEYVTDFGVHLLVKPFVKAFQWFGIPLLLVTGVAGPAVLAVFLFWGGAIVRTLYTGGRLLQATFAGQRKPWIALGIGTLPVVGNAAYPAELVASSVGDAHLLARFLLYDTSAAVGRSLPVWGGRDTLTEHLANRLPDAVLPTR